VDPRRAARVDGRGTVRSAGLEKRNRFCWWALATLYAEQLWHQHRCTTGCEKPIPYIYNNTIVGSRQNGIKLSEYVGPGFVRDNIVAGAGSNVAIDVPYFIQLTNNRDGAVTQFGFQDPTRLDFHLGFTSSAWNQGSAEFPPTDFDDEARPRDGAPDPGAFEGTD